ncbi:MAG: outer membrane beta-barrel protein [Bacteroidetes bacterium]|nr:outer membrane beta-barrel protein [Bacteroidota bacterium]MCW5897545.1 outer membrane beta-barrel protein [Bacteroidota bacterium]
MHPSKIITLSALCFVLAAHSGYSQKSSGRIGVGVNVGETVSIGLVPVPMYGASFIYVVTPSIYTGVQLGLLSGSASGDDKAFDRVTAFEVSPYAKILFTPAKELSPFFKLNIAFINYNAKFPATNSDPESTSNESYSSLWGTFGLSYALGKNVQIIGQVRFFDIGMSGKGKISQFGIGAPAVGIEVFF